jgi:hypothetical protein
MNQATNKKIITFLTISIVILAAIIVAVQFQVVGITKAEDKEPLTVILAADNTRDYTPFRVNFTSKVFNYEGDLEYEWDFGDGNTSNEANPSHVFSGNDSFLCQVLVKDSSGEKANDSIKIMSLINKKPSVSIVPSDSSITREYIPILPQLSSKMGGRSLYQLRQVGLIPQSLENRKSHVSCKALVSDPDGDEIVSYNWTLNGPTITTLKGQIDPQYFYSGEEITFDLLDIYIEGNYDLQIVVTDEAGNQDSETIPLKVSSSNIEGQGKLLKFYVFDLFLNQIYQDYFPEEMKYKVSDPIWFGGKLGIWPGLEKISEKIIEFIENRFPPKLQELTLKLLGTLLDLIENKFPKRPQIEFAELLLSDIPKINHSSNVNSAGGVPVEASISSTFSIYNNDSVNVSKNTYVMLYDPTKEDNFGLDDALEKNELEISIKKDGVSKKIFENGEYNKGFFIGDIHPDHNVVLEIIVKLKQAKSGTFVKETYDNCKLFVVQNGNNADAIDFTIDLE